MSSDKHSLIVTPQNLTLEIKEGQTLLDCLKNAGLYVKSSCGGHATCSDCIVKIRSGLDHLSPQEFPELKLLGNVFHITKERLACQTKVTGTVTVDLTEHDKAKHEESLHRKTVKQNQKKQDKLKKMSFTLRKGGAKDANEKRPTERPKARRLSEGPNSGGGGFNRPKNFPVLDDEPKGKKE